MKIVTLGLSPYLYISTAKIHSLILKHLFFNHHEVACIANSHDTTYFLPKDTSNGPVHYYSFDSHDIPLIPMNPSVDPSVMIYNVVQILKPDVLITIGDFNDYLYIKAVKMFSDIPFKWFAVLANWSYPINEKNVEVLESIDGMLCTNHDSYAMFQKKYPQDEIHMCHVGFIENVLNKKEPDDFRIMTCGRNSFSDNLPMLMEAVSEINRDSQVELYLHTNVHDPGDYDLNLVKERCDPEDTFIRFPDKYVSLMDGYPIENYRQELAKSSMFVSLSVNAASAISVFDAISVGCLPLMSDVGCHRDIADILAKYIPNFKMTDFLVPCIEIMVKGEVYMNVCRPDLLKSKILELRNKIKKGGHRSFLQELIKDNNRRGFLDKVSKAVEKIKITNPTICVEAV